MSKSNPKPEAMKALPPPAAAAAETPGKDPPPKEPAPSNEKPPSWAMKFGAGIGAFIAGITAGTMAGYYFCKAETRFSSFGENLLGQIWKAMRPQENGRGYAERRPARWESPPDFPDRNPRRTHHSGDDPMGESSGSDVQEDDTL